MDTRKILGTLIAVICVIVVVAGATYAYYGITVTNNSVTGNGATLGVTLNVSLASTAATGQLIPQSTSTLSSALTGTNGSSCIDANSYTVCKVYTITIKNTGNSTNRFNAQISFSTTGSMTDLKWEQLQTVNTLKSTRTTYSASTTETTWLSDAALASNATNTYYIVVWVANNTAAEQNTTNYGNFIGTITVNTAAGSLSSRFTS